MQCATHIRLSFIEKPDQHAYCPHRLRAGFGMGHSADLGMGLDMDLVLVPSMDSLRS